VAGLHPDWKRQVRRWPSPPLEQPIARNVEVVAHSRMEGRVDGLQLQFQSVGSRHFLYVGHFWSAGVSILDVTDPRSPQVVAFIPSQNEHTWHVKVQVAENILMIGCEAGLFNPRADRALAELGVRFFDVSDPCHPQELSFWESARPGFGVHRSWWNGGQYAYLSHGVAAPGISYQGSVDRTRVMTILDVSDPEQPRKVSDFWLPTQTGEAPPPDPRITFGVHQPLVEGDRAYVAYADGGFAIVDVSERERPRLVSHVSTFPELSDGQTHTCLPLPERNLLVVSDEAMAPFGLEGPKDITIWDISDEERPTLVSTFLMPEPVLEEPYSSYFLRGERFGPHCLHENHTNTMRVTDKVYNAYMNAGLRVWDISDPTNPVETASFVPPDPTEWTDTRPYNRLADAIRGGTRGACSQDVLVDPRGYIYLSGYNDGIWILRETAGAGEKGAV
jgi:hypothetical protein